VPFGKRAFTATAGGLRVEAGFFLGVRERLSAAGPAAAALHAFSAASAGGAGGQIEDLAPAALGRWTPRPGKHGHGPCRWPVAAPGGLDELPPAVALNGPLHASIISWLSGRKW